MEGIDVFNDPNVTVVGKIFLAGIASAVLGCPPHIKVRGTPEQVEAIKNAVDTAREFQAILDQPGAMIQDIMDKLSLKNISAERFKEILGLPFPL